MKRLFNITNDHTPKDGLTISTSSRIKAETNITYFSLGKDTDITPESYNNTIIYYVLSGDGFFNVDGNNKEVKTGDMIYVLPNTLCGCSTTSGLVYVETIIREDVYMNKQIKSKEVFKLSELLPYQEDSIVNMDIASNDAMKYVVMSFDQGTSLSPHKAPGDALVFALEGRAIIEYEGEEYEINAGETFRFDKFGLHSIKAITKFKMALLITLK